MRLFVLAVVCSLGVLVAARADACTTCGAGDATLTATGVERPYKNRVRVTLDERYGSLAVGDATYGRTTWFLRSTLAASWSPIARLTVVAQLPWISAWLRDARGTTDTLNGLGDLELSVRGVVFRERGFAPRHLLWLSGGIKCPTGPRQLNARGYAYPEDDQPGSGSWDPFAGVTYAWLSGGLVSIFASMSGRVATPNPRDYQRGSSLGASAAVQLQPHKRIAFLGGINASYADRDRMSQGVRLPDTGGFLASVVPGILVSPAGNLLIRVDADIPFATALAGTQSFGPQARVSLAYDVN